MVTRISMDLVVDPKDSTTRRGLTNPRNREAMTEACVDVLRRLGKLAEAVNAFRVTFSENKEGNWEAVIKTYFSDPMGTECSDTINYEFVASEGNPDYRVIAMRICRVDFLERAIRDHIERGRAKHQQAAERFSTLM